MREEILRLINQAEIAQEINKRANELINGNFYSDFTRVHLRVIAELSATKAIVASREATAKLKAWEDELTECKKLYEERRQPVYDDNQKEEPTESEEEK